MSRAFGFNPPGKPIGMRRAISLLAAVGATLALAGSAGAAGGGIDAHGQLLTIRANTNQSSNWFGYDLGSLERGDTLFNSITGDWTVPTVSQHTTGQDEYSSDWIGIGGGCVDAGCSVGDETLIQTGTEQDVSATGQASYSAWWELVPDPSMAISMTVEPGDHIHAAIAEVVADSDVWTITLQDVTRNETFTQTVPYSSTHATAEWIEETPLILGTSPGLASLPNLTSPMFDGATVNGRPASLKPSEEIELTDSNGSVIGTPSAPDPEADGFNACTWATTCAAPTSATTQAPLRGSACLTKARSARASAGRSGHRTSRSGARRSRTARHPKRSSGCRRRRTRSHGHASRHSSR